MPETFLILLAGGVMLAAAISDPREVTIHWLRLSGIIALSLSGLSLFFCWRRQEYDPSVGVPAILLGYFPIFAAVLVQLPFVQAGWRQTPRISALFAYLGGVWGAMLILPRSAGQPLYGHLISLAPALALAGVSAMTGLVLMDMLLGHAYLTASRMTMQPFVRLNRSLAAVAVLRLLVATAGIYFLNSLHPVRMLLGIYGLLMMTRWLVGLAVPFVFIYMADDCIKRRATQSATGILYVCGVLIFIGEMIALSLVRDTALPF